MAPPPSTPAPSKFLLSRGKGRQSQSQHTPTQQQQQQPQQQPQPPRFQATPRFTAPSSSSAATPRTGPGASQRQPPPFFSATPSATAAAGGGAGRARPAVFDADVIHDDDDDDDDDDGEEDESLPSSFLPAAAGEPLPSDDDDEDMLLWPPLPANASKTTPSTARAGIPARELEPIEVDSGTNTQVTSSRSLIDDTIFTDQPPPKRRRISVSSAEDDDDDDDLPAPAEEIQDHLSMSIDDHPSDPEEADQPTSTTPPRHRRESVASHSHSPASHTDDNDYDDDGPSSPSARPPTNFHPPPRFRPPLLDHHHPTTTEQHDPAAHPYHELPDAFSPQRRRGVGGLRYVPGGLAAQLRDWLVQIKGGSSTAAAAAAEDEAKVVAAPGEGNGGRGFVENLAVEEVHAGAAPGMVLLRGRGAGPRPDGQVDDDRAGGESTLVMLAGEGRVEDVNARNVVGPGAVVGVAQPVWEVDLEEHGGQRWMVACDWAVL